MAKYKNIEEFKGKNADKVTGKTEQAVQDMYVAAMLKEMLDNPDSKGYAKIYSPERLEKAGLVKKDEMEQQVVYHEAMARLDAEIEYDEKMNAFYAEMEPLVQLLNGLPDAPTMEEIEKIKGDETVKTHLKVVEQEAAAKQAVDAKNEELKKTYETVVGGFNEGKRKKNNQLLQIADYCAEKGHYDIALDIAGLVAESHDEEPVQPVQAPKPPKLHYDLKFDNMPTARLFEKDLNALIPGAEVEYKQLLGEESALPPEVIVRVDSEISMDAEKNESFNSVVDSYRSKWEDVDFNEDEWVDFEARSDALGRHFKIMQGKNQIKTKIGAALRSKPYYMKVRPAIARLYRKAIESDEEEEPMPVPKQEAKLTYAKDPMPIEDEITVDYLRFATAASSDGEVAEDASLLYVSYVVQEDQHGNTAPKKEALKVFTKEEIGAFIDRAVNSAKRKGMVPRELRQAVEVLEDGVHSGSKEAYKVLILDAPSDILEVVETVESAPADGAKEGAK